MTNRELIIACKVQTGCEECPYLGKECSAFMKTNDGRAPDEFCSFLEELDKKVECLEGE